MIHSFQTEDATKYGLVEAVMLNNFRYWITHNKANKAHEHDGKTWTYNSVKAFESLFPYMSSNQIRRCLESLVSQGVLLRGNYNTSPYDKTSWFAFSDEFLCLSDVAILPNRIGDSAQSDTDIKTIRKPLEEHPLTPKGEMPIPQGFADFWQAWPTNDRKQAKGKCLEAWKKVKAEKVAREVIDHVESLKNSAWLRDDGRYIPAPLVYINQRRWEGAEISENHGTRSGMIPGAI